eukprot:Sspe_Gene.113140::Locus_97059_Transcript_1_1_Confidence_1.000_Length_353::g.113140::m.113140
MAAAMDTDSQPVVANGNSLPTVHVEVLLRHDVQDYDPQEIEEHARQLVHRMLTSFAPGKDIPFSHVRELRNVVKSIKVSDTLQAEVPCEQRPTVTINIARLHNDSTFIE